jgi:hypothetical protein
MPKKRVYHHVEISEKPRQEKIELIHELREIGIHLKKKTNEMLSKLPRGRIEEIVTKLKKRIKKLESEIGSPIVEELTEADIKQIANFLWQLWKRGSESTTGKINSNEYYTITIPGHLLFSINKLARRLYSIIKKEKNSP